MQSPEIAALALAIAEARDLLRRHGGKGTSARLERLGTALERGDMAAISAALSEATGGMGSLRDRFLSADNGDDIGHDDVGPASQRLGFLVKQIERRARAAAAALGIELVLHDRFPTRRDAASGP